MLTKCISLRMQESEMRFICTTLRDYIKSEVKVGRSVGRSATCSVWKANSEHLEAECYGEYLDLAKLVLEIHATRNFSVHTFSLLFLLTLVLWRGDLSES